MNYGYPAKHIKAGADCQLTTRKWHFAARSIFLYPHCTVLCITEWCDTQMHILSHITARHLITRSTAAKFKCASDPQWATHMHLGSVRHVSLKPVVIARHGSLHKVRIEPTSEFLTQLMSSSSNSYWVCQATPFHKLMWGVVTVVFLFPFCYHTDSQALNYT